MDTVDYYNKLDSIINDETKFEKMSFDANDDHPIIKKQNSVKYYVETYLKDKTEVDLKNKLIPVGSKPAKLYGLCKVHKSNHPMRPVVSMIGTPEYELTKFIDSIIKPNIPDTFMLKSTNDFIEKIKKL